MCKKIINYNVKYIVYQNYFFTFSGYLKLVIVRFVQ
jgi:hypothetical protein